MNTMSLSINDDSLNEEETKTSMYQDDDIDDDEQEQQQQQQQQQQDQKQDIFKNSQIFSMVCEIDEDTLCLDCGSECPGFKTHEWRNICQMCKCPRDCHDLRFKGYVTAGEKLGLNDEQLENLKLNLHNKYSILEKGFTWQPSGLSLEEILLFFENYPQDQIPRLGSHGEKWREKALIYQIPKQDVCLDNCRFIKTNEAREEYEKFINDRNMNALDIGICKVNNKDPNLECEYCQKTIELDTVQVNASLVLQSNNNENSIAWHPSCFCCHKCNEILVDLVYCVKDNNIYCLRHYAEELVPRCSGCDELMLYNYLILL